MFEYTRELLNTNCDLDFIKIVVERTHVLGHIENNKIGKKKLIYDITTERDVNCSLFNIYKRNEKYDYELSWKFALELIVKQLKKKFIDSNIYYENREILDIYDNISIPRLIIDEWN